MELQTISVDPARSLFRLGIANIRCADDLAVIRRVRNRRHLQILLRVPGLSPDKSSVWESKLNSGLEECGCSLGAKCMFGALAGSVLWQFFYSSWSISHWPGFLLRTVLAVIAAGGAGKFLGLALAEARIQAIEKQIRQFESRFSQEVSDVNLYKVGR